MIAIRIATFVRPKGGYVMKRALICGMGVVALMAGVQDVYAQARPAGVNAGGEWYASVGPIRRGNMCVSDVDINRGYGFLKPCPAPQAPARRQARVAR
jgi:hypothetical protein